MIVVLKCEASPHPVLLLEGEGTWGMVSIYKINFCVEIIEGLHSCAGGVERGQGGKYRYCRFTVNKVDLTNVCVFKQIV